MPIRTHAKHRTRTIRPPVKGRAGRARHNAMVSARKRFPRRYSAASARQGAQSRLRMLRQSGIVAVAMTALLLLLLASPDTLAQPADADVGATESAPESLPTAEEATEEDAVDGVEQATGTLREMVLTFYRLIPSVLIAIALLVVAWGLATVVQWVLRKTLGHWERSDAISALIRITLFLLAIAVATSIIAGDARALVGSVGLVGLALSWALQTPIESFTGWLLNSFRGYYRVGDRIEVGDVFGDVYRIDVLTTTVWEAGGPGKAVAGAQPTGAMITFPNWEVLRSNIVNYSRDFPFVWDEVTLPVTNESDLDYAVSIVERVARAAVGEEMAQPAQQYRKLLARARLAFDVIDRPEVFVSSADSWMNLTVRYLTPARQRRRYSTRLMLALSRELARPEHRPHLRAGHPRTDVLLLQRDGQPAEPPSGDRPSQPNPTA